MKEDQKSLMPIETALTSEEFQNKYHNLIEFVKSQLRESTNMAGGGSGDFGVIPYTKKKTLLKPGAEKLLKLFGFAADNQLVKEIEDFEKGLVFYKYKCVITHITYGTFIASAIRSCNNKEKKFMGQSAYESANNVDARAQKRALVAATVQACMASEIFDADVSENEEVAPSRPITKEEDPRRINITSQLYGTATRYGIGNNWIHVAVKKKYNVDSLSDLANEQIEELTELIMANYDEVEKGEKPKRKLPSPSPSPEITQETNVDSKEEIKDAEVVEGQKELEEKRKQLGIIAKQMQEDTRRCEACKISLSTDYPGLYVKCKDCRMKDFIEAGRLKKIQEESQQQLTI